MRKTVKVVCEENKRLGYKIINVEDMTEEDVLFNEQGNKSKTHEKEKKPKTGTEGKAKEQTGKTVEKKEKEKKTAVTPVPPVPPAPPAK